MLLAGPGIAGYTLLVGADGAVVRAAIMDGLSLFTRQIGQRQDSLNGSGQLGLVGSGSTWMITRPKSGTRARKNCSMRSVIS
jgi:hypothetical protein